MTEKESNYRHDVKRNISTVLAGLAQVSKKVPDDDPYFERAVEEMKTSCLKALEALEKIYNERSNAQEQGV